MSSVYPQAIKEIVEGRSFIRCNFLTGELHDPQRVLDNHRHITYDPIKDPGGYCPGDLFEEEREKLRGPLPSLPNFFADLALEDVCPEDQQ